MRFFGTETELERERRERHEAELRRDRDAAGNARRRADQIEAEREREWRRIQKEGQAKTAWPKPAAIDPATAAEAARRAGEHEQERRRSYDSKRLTAVNEAMAARNAKEAALRAGDIEGYVTAFNREAGLKAFVNELDENERTLRQLAATPTMHGAARL